MHCATSALQFQAYHIWAPVILSILLRLSFFPRTSLSLVILGRQPRASKVWVTAREDNVDTRRQEKHDEGSTAKYPRWAYTRRRCVIYRNIAYVACWRRLTPSHFCQRADPPTTRAIHHLPSRARELVRIAPIGGALWQARKMARQARRWRWSLLEKISFPLLLALDPARPGAMWV